MKKWKETTRGGIKVRIYAQDGGGRYPIHGAVFEDNRWHQQKWRANGRFINHEIDHPDDLIPVRREVWVNEYPCGVLGCPRNSIEEAKANDNGDSIGVIKFIEALDNE